MKRVWSRTQVIMYLYFKAEKKIFKNKFGQVHFDYLL